MALRFLRFNALWRSETQVVLPRLKFGFNFDDTTTAPSVISRFPGLLTTVAVSVDATWVPDILVLTRRQEVTGIEGCSGRFCITPELLRPRTGVTAGGRVLNVTALAPTFEGRSLYRPVS